MMSMQIILSGLGVMLLMAVATWLLSLKLQDVSIVDSVWSLFFVAGTLTYAALAPTFGTRVIVVLALVVIWALRLSVYLTWRNWGQPEDRRYRAMRDNHEPGFGLKSLYIIFGLQAVLAWIISLPLYAAVTGPWPLGTLDYLGAALVISGIVFETTADLQLARFKAQRENAGRVLDTGLWRYTRHPNYFGDFCVWWGFYLIAVSAGGWWTIFAPLLMSVLLMKVSGVTLLEKDIGQRRPKYADYIARTNAFFPGLPSRKAAHEPGDLPGSKVAR
jgi:steroid 5-alpha reductase family enzyme